MEYNLTIQMLIFRSKNFHTGAQAILIDKIKERAKWEPESIDEVDEEMLEPYFRNVEGEKLSLCESMVPRL